MLALLVYVVVGVIVIAVLWWVLSQLPLPPPLAQIVNIALVVIAAIFVIYILLQFADNAPPLRLR